MYSSLAKECLCAEHLHDITKELGWALFQVFMHSPVQVFIHSLTLSHAHPLTLSHIHPSHTHTDDNSNSSFRPGTMGWWLPCQRGGCYFFFTEGSISIGDMEECPTDVEVHTCTIHDDIIMMSLETVMC